MYLIYLITSIFLILIIRRQGRNSFNPLIIYILIWLFVVSLYSLKLIPYNDTNLVTWLVIIFTPIIIWLGYSSMHLITPNNTIKSIFNPSKLGYLKLFIYFFGTLLLIRAISIWLGIYFRFGSFSAAFTNGDMIYNMSRNGQWAPGIGFYIPVDYITLLFAGIYHKLKGKLNLLIVIVLISALLVHVGLQSRFALLMNFAIYFGAYMGANNAQLKIKFSYILKFIVLAIILVSIISLSRNLAESNSLSGEWGEYGGTFLPSVYYYLTNGIAGLNEYVIIGKDETDMLYTFNPILYLYSLIDTSVIVNIYETKTYYTPAPTIIATWIRFLIDDFGYVGTFLVLYLYGVLLKYVEFKLKKTFSVFLISIYVHILAMFVLSFFSYGFFLISFWYSLFISSFIGLIIDSNIAGILFGSIIKKKNRK